MYWIEVEFFCWQQCACYGSNDNCTVCIFNQQNPYKSSHLCTCNDVIKKTKHLIYFAFCCKQKSSHLNCQLRH